MQLNFWIVSNAFTSTTKTNHSSQYCLTFEMRMFANRMEKSKKITHFIRYCNLHLICQHASHISLFYQIVHKNFIVYARACVDIHIHQVFLLHSFLLEVSSAIYSENFAWIFAHVWKSNRYCISEIGMITFQWYFTHDFLAIDLWIGVEFERKWYLYFSFQEGEKKSRYNSKKGNRRGWGERKISNRWYLNWFHFPLLHLHQQAAVSKHRKNAWLSLSLPCNKVSRLPKCFFF